MFSFCYIDVKLLLMIKWFLQCLFRTPLTNYDAVVLLHRDKLAHSGLLFPSEMNQGVRSILPGPFGVCGKQKKNECVYHRVMCPIDGKVLSCI